MQEGVRIDEGLLNLTGRVERADGLTGFDAGASIDVLRGRRGDEAVSWDAPTRLAVRGRQGPDLLVLDHGEIASPFLTGTAAGTLDALRLHLDASLDQAIAEAGKFVDLGGWTASGDVAIDLSVEKADTIRRLAGAVVSPALSLARGPAVIAPSAPVRVGVSAALTLPDGAPVAALQDIAADWQAWLGSGRIRAEHLEPPAAGDLPVLHGLSASGNLDLGALAAALQAAGVLPADVVLGGTGEFEVSAEAGPRRLELPAMTLTLHDLTAGNAAGAIREPLVELAGSGEIEPAGPVLRLPALTCSLGAGAVRLSDTVVSGGDLSTRAAGQAELQPLLAMLGDFLSLPEGTSVSGTGIIEASLAVEGGRVGVSAQSALNDLEIVTAAGEAIREERAEFSAVLAADGEAGTLTVREARLASEALQFRASAEKTRDGGRHGLSASGELGLDLERVAAYVRALLGIELEMAGRQSQPFEFASAWQDGETNGLIRHARMTAGLHAERIEAFGLTVAGLDIPLQVEDGTARLQITGQVNEGELQVRSVIDFTAQPPVATLLAPTNLLTGVQLTDELSAELLARIHPLFKGASQVTGELTLGMNEFVWPLAAEARAGARFDGWMQFAGLRMQTHGLLEKILGAMKVRERNAEFGDRDLAFRCENERITCSPLQFTVDGHEVSITGSMGLDQSLDYSAQIPVTESLVGEGAIRYLEGTTIRVPIRGTAAEPDLRVNVLAEATGDLLKQAAQKALREGAGSLLEGLLNR